jgi:hypothetical protein
VYTVPSESESTDHAGSVRTPQNFHWFIVRYLSLTRVGHAHLSPKVTPGASLPCVNHLARSHSRHRCSNTNRQPLIARVYDCFLLLRYAHFVASTLTVPHSSKPTRAVESANMWQLGAGEGMSVAIRSSRLSSVSRARRSAFPSVRGGAATVSHRFLGTAVCRATMAEEVEKGLPFAKAKLGGLSTLQWVFAIAWGTVKNKLVTSRFLYRACNASIILCMISAATLDTRTTRCRWGSGQ